MTIQRFTLRYGKTVVYFGFGALKDLENIVNRCRRAYIVTSRTAARVSGALDDVESILRSSNTDYEIFDSIRPNPMEDSIESLADEIKKFNPEYVIAIGGGSVIDSAKVASALALCGGRVKDYVLGGKSIHSSKPVIAINLTHGTGSEVNRYAVVTLKDPKTKFGLASDHFYPIASFEDPRYTVSMPHKQVVYTSLDAFYHAYEAATGKNTSPYVLLLAEEIVKVIAQWLPIAVRDQKNLEARYWLMYASMLAGIAIDNSRAHIIHVIENVLSGMNTGLPHGAGLAILGPTAAIYIHSAVPQYSYRVLRHLDPSITPSKDGAQKACEAIAKFQASIGFSEKLEDYGFSERDAEDVAGVALDVLGYGLRLTPFDVDRDVVKTIYLRSLRPE